MYPEFIEIDGKNYKIDTDYRTALSCFEAINDETISDTERVIAICVLLLGEDFPIELIDKAIEKCYVYLRCGKEENICDEEIDMDYEQDRRYINASFMSRYHIAIEKEKMHWWEYNDFIEGFGEEDILSRVRYIRTLDTTKITNKEERDQIIAQQERVRLKRKKTLEEKEIDKQWDVLLRKE